MLKESIETDKQLINYAGWHQGDLSHLLHHVQIEINTAIKNEDIVDDVGVWLLNCTRRIGKTRGALVYAIERCLQRPNTVVYFAHPVKDQVRRIVRVELAGLLSKCPKTLRPKQRGEYFTLFNNGSSIELVGLDKQPDGLRGTGANVVIIDEAAQVNDLSYAHDNVILPLLRRQHNPKCILLSTPNPKETENDFKNMCNQAKLNGGKNYFEFNIYQSPLETTQKIANIIKHYEKEGIKDGTTAIKFQTEYMCQFVIDTELLVVPNWDEKFILRDKEYKKLIDTLHYPHWKKFTTLDPGYRDKTAALFAYYNPQKGQLVIEDEYITTIMKEPAHIMAPILIKKEKDLWSYIDYGNSDMLHRIADSNVPMFLDSLMRHGITFQGIKSKDRKREMVGELRRLIAQGRIIIHERCSSLLGCLKNGLWDTAKASADKFAHSEVYGHYDALDALIYMVHTLDTQNYLPRNIDMEEGSRVFYPEDRFKNQEEEVISFDEDGGDFKDEPGT